MTDDPLWEAITAAHARWSPGGPERSPARSEWGLPQAVAGDRSNLMPQGVAVAVPRVPRVPSEKQDTRQRTSDELAADAWASWEERAAILEHVAGVSRIQAERLTMAELGACPLKPVYIDF